jgi:pimeloyl-ACP methyl ester carboxylesterase
MDMRKSLPPLTKAIPTIFLWGENDSFALPETGRALEPLLPDVKFHWVTKASHQVQTDQPKVCADIIRAFVGK